MLHAALKEIRTAPLASLGALAGIASFVVVVATPTISTGATPPVVGQSPAAALALIKVAVVVPGVSFFFAYFAHMTFHAGPLRGLLGSTALLIISEVFTSAASGLVLLSVRVRYSLDTPTVLDIPVVFVAGAIYILNALVFAAVIAPTLLAAIESLKPSHDEDEQAEPFGSGPEVVLVMYAALATLVASFGLVFVVLSASLGLPLR